MYLLNFLMVSHPNTPVLPQNTKISDFKNSGNQNTQVFHIGNFFPIKTFYFMVYDLIVLNKHRSKPISWGPKYFAFWCLEIFLISSQTNQMGILKLFQFFQYIKAKTWHKLSSRVDSKDKRLWRCLFGL